MLGGFDSLHGEMEEDVEQGVVEEGLPGDGPAVVGEEDGDGADPGAARGGERGEGAQRHRRVRREPADDHVRASDRRPVRRLPSKGASIISMRASRRGSKWPKELAN